MQTQSQLNYLALKGILTKLIYLTLTYTTTRPIVESVLAAEKSSDITFIIPRGILKIRLLVQNFDDHSYFYNSMAILRLIIFDLQPFFAIFLLYLCGRISWYAFYRLFNLFQILFWYYKKTKGFSAVQWSNEFQEFHFFLQQYFIFKIQQMKLYFKNIFSKNKKKILFSCLVFILGIILYLNKHHSLLKPLRRNLRNLRRYVKQLDYRHVKWILDV